MAKIRGKNLSVFKELMSIFYYCWFLIKQNLKRNVDDYNLYSLPLRTSVEALPVNLCDHLSRLSVLKANISTAYIIKPIHAAALSTCVLFS